MKILTFLILFSASVVLAEDFKTIDGKEYKNVKISRVEPDGLVLKSKSGISKVYFAELPKEIQQRFHYDPVKAAQFTAGTEAAAAQANAAAAETEKQKAQQEGLARMQKYRIQGQVRRKTNDGLIVELGNFGGGVAHNATDIPMGIKNPMNWPGFRVVLLKGYPDQETLADGEEVDAVAYDGGVSSGGTSTYHCFVFYSR